MKRPFLVSLSIAALNIRSAAHLLGRAVARCLPCAEAMPERGLPWLGELSKNTHSIE
jgi:hypothetical protein